MTISRDGVFLGGKDCIAVEVVFVRRICSLLSCFLVMFQ